MNTPHYFGSVGIIGGAYWQRRGWLGCGLSGLRALLTEAVTSVAAANERARSRQQLARLDARLLADIGLARADVILERRKPSWMD